MPRFDDRYRGCVPPSSSLTTPPRSLPLPVRYGLNKVAFFRTLHARKFTFRVPPRIGFVAAAAHPFSAEYLKVYRPTGRANKMQKLRIQALYNRQRREEADRAASSNCEQRTANTTVYGRGSRAATRFLRIVLG